jgi:hypothetical protein
MDVEQVVRMARIRFECTEYLVEAFPVYNPDLGPDFLGATASPGEWWSDMEEVFYCDS